MPAALRIGPQPGPQSRLLSCPCEEVFYGGARGGGKSFGALLDFVYFAAEHGGKVRGIMFRRTIPELEDMHEKAQRVLPLFGFYYAAQARTWRHPNGAYLKLRYLEREAHVDRYQGHEYNWLCFEEAGSWPTSGLIDKMRPTARAPGRKRFLLTGNPGGAGHNWLKRRYIDPCPPMGVRRVGQWDVVFIPAKLKDNPILLQDNPGYIDQLRASGPAWLVKAWLEGDWNVVAGGMLDDLWQDAVHLLEPFALPASWRIRRAFDWGSSKPFSVGWWAESDGTPVTIRGSQRTFYRGTRIRVAEWYGWNGTPNEGVKLTATEIAKGIKDREQAMGLAGRVRIGPADSAIFDVENGRSIAQDFGKAGIAWEPCVKGPGSRRQGWEQIRKRLKAGLKHPMEEPGLFAFNTCRDGFTRTLPVLPRDVLKPDDVDDKAEDHVGDETRYEVMTPYRDSWTIETRGV